MLQRPLASLVLCLALAACGVTQSSIRNMQSGLQQDRAELEAARSAGNPILDYAKALRSTGPRGSYVLLTPADVLRAMGEFLPYDMPAQDLMGTRGSGRFVIKQATQPQFLSRNRVHLRLLFQGIGVNVSGVPAAYAGEVAKVKEGIAAGAWADIEATLLYYPQTGGLSIRTTCRDVNLLRNNESKYRSEIQTYINRLLDRPIVIGIPTLNGLRAEGVFVTGNHVVVEYAQ